MTDKMKSFVKGILLGQFGHPLPQGEKEPVTYLYNGIPFPAFPENHEEMYAKKEEYEAYRMEYPYLVVVYNDAYREYFLYYCHVPQKYFSEDGWTWIGTDFYDESVVNYNMEYRINLSTKEWKPRYPSDVYITSEDKLVWSNHDILNNEDGSVYFAASEPIPAYEFPAVVRDPQYSYNGFVYPKLPEWDKETYPYAFIYDYGIVAGVDLYVFPVKPMVRLDTDGTPILYSEESFELLYFNLLPDELQWWATPEVQYWDEPNSGNSYGNFETPTFPLWSNFDACDSEGTVYLAASEPVPVYE